jgi:hypothetical protein
MHTITFESGSQLETIESGGFLATGITTITLPKTLKTIGERAFYNCKSLTQILYEDGIAFESIGIEAFGYTEIAYFYIPASCTTIYGESKDAGSFLNCEVWKVGLNLYCESASKQSGWGQYWNYFGTDSDEVANVYYGYSYAQFKSAVGW